MHPSIATRSALLACLLSAACAGLALAAPAKPIPTTTVALADNPALFAHGKSAVYRGVADKQGVAFVIPGLTINTAAALVLEAGDGGTPMQLQLKNDFSQGWDRTLTTDGKGIASTRFRTEGPAVALVSSSDGASRPYRLVVWVGNEIKPHTAAAPPFAPPGHHAAEGGRGRTLPLLLAGLLLAGAGLFWMHKRRASA